jgi:hypothetical protein
MLTETIVLDVFSRAFHITLFPLSLNFIINLIFDIAKSYLSSTIYPHEHLELCFDAFNSCDACIPLLGDVVTGPVTSEGRMRLALDLTATHSRVTKNVVTYRTSDDPLVSKSVQCRQNNV